MNTITIEQVQATENYSKLTPIQKMFVVKRQNRELLTNGLTAFNTTGVVCGSIQGYNIGILNDLIAKSKE